MTLDSLALDDMVVENIEVGVIGEFDGSPFDGLLGMKLLRHFEFSSARTNAHYNSLNTDRKEYGQW